MGPTASGKTAVAVELAERLPVELISVDSALVYRGMNIGTAKPDATTLARAPHHLLDIIDPTESYSAAAFRHDALRLMADITARGRIPLLVGGTMLYFKALREGLSELPQADPALRAQLDAEIAANGIEALHQRLATLDPITAARLHPTDTQRIQRAMEVCLLSKRPMSALFDNATQTAKEALPYTLLPIALVPGDRAVLHTRIATRFETMLQQGLLDEVRQLRRAYPSLHAELPSMRCVGYRQAWQYLEGEIDYDQLRETGLAATRQLAKRQLTWLRGMAGVMTVDSLLPAPEKIVLAGLQDWLRACQG
jgi:tRNA dimethylallyltransferase